MMVHRHACPVEDCETFVDTLDREGDLSCADHGEALEYDGPVGCVRGLSEGQVPAEDVRHYAEGLRHQQHWGGAEKALADDIADELESLAARATEAATDAE